MAPTTQYCAIGSSLRRPTSNEPQSDHRKTIYGYMQISTCIWNYAAIWTTARVARSFNAHQPVARRADAVEVQLPHLEVLLAGGDDRVLHVEFFREALDRAPARVGVLDVGFFVQLEELQIVAGQLEELPTALALKAEPAVLSHDAGTVARHVCPLGAGVGDDALQPVAVSHKSFPRGPGELRGGNRRRGADLAALQADARSQVFQDLPVRAAAAVLVVGDDFLAAGLDDADARFPVRAVGRDLELQHRVALSRIEPVLHGEHARPALRHLLVEIARAAAEVVDRLVQPREDAPSRHSDRL